MVAGLLLAMRRVPLLLVQWAVFAMSLVDGIFLSALVVVTGGYDSILYWLFLALIVRGAVSVPRATSQILLNLTLTACYVMAGVHQYLRGQGPGRRSPVQCQRTRPRRVMRTCAVQPARPPAPAAIAATRRRRLQSRRAANRHLAAIDLDESVPGELRRSTARRTIWPRP